MKSKNLMMILILFSFINKIRNDDTSAPQNPPQLGIDYPGIKCGKDNPDEEKDCTKFGTDSGMLCCYVQFTNKTKICTLLNIVTAENKEFDIKGTKTFSDGQFWSCGNKSFNLSISFTLFLILFFLY